jgi:HJR/Mrr/RecB family endonuclease
VIKFFGAVASLLKDNQDADTNQQLIESQSETKDLISIHQIALAEFLFKLKPSSDSHYSDNKTICFLNEVLVSSPYCPKYEFFSNWIKRKDIPKHVIDFGVYVHEAVKSKDRYFRSERKRKTEEELDNKKAERIKVKEEEKKIRRLKIETAKTENIKAALFILQAYQERIEKYFEITFRRVIRLDDYGDENWGAVEEETKRLIKKISELSTIKTTAHYSIADLVPSVSDEIHKLLVKQFKEYYEIKKANTSTMTSFKDLSKLSGVEFEHYLLELLKSIGVNDIVNTKTTGDQGADLIFIYEGTKVVVQAKRWESSVGNSAIQEVYAAKGFYHCDEAWVITNSRYTKSAQDLAIQLNVKLFDNFDLSNFEDSFRKCFQIIKKTG